MRIVFMATPEFAVPSLDVLVKNGYDIAAVVTAPSKKAGRGLQVRDSAIKQYADKAAIPVFQPLKLSDPDFIKTLYALKAELFIVVAFRMLPEAVWKMPALGTFNLHGSLLPDYRGAAPINRAIMNGETETGVTTFFLRHEIDTGNIIFRESISIPPDATAGDLHDNMMLAGAQMVLKTVQAIEKNNVITHSQDEFTGAGVQLKMAPKIFTADCKINWNECASKVHNLVRGLSPFPGAFTHLEDNSGNRMLLKIYRSRPATHICCGEPGNILISDNSMFISCLDFPLEILEVQLEGKRRISAAEFLRGFRIEKAYKATG